MKRLLAVIMMVAFAVLAFGGVAFAQDGGDVVDKDLVYLDVNLLAMVGGLIVPIVTAIVTTRWSSSALKAVVTALLSVLAGSISVWIEHAGAADLEQFALAVFQAAVIAWASYYGFWKPTTVAPKVSDATGSFGIGTRSSANP